MGNDEQVGGAAAMEVRGVDCLGVAQGTGLRGVKENEFFYCARGPSEAQGVACALIVDDLCCEGVGDVEEDEARRGIADLKDEGFVFLSGVAETQWLPVVAEECLVA